MRPVLRIVFLLWILLIFFVLGSLVVGKEKQSSLLAYISEADGAPDIFIGDADFGIRFNLTEHRVRDHEIRWSPNGQYLAFLSSRDGDEAIWLADMESYQLRKVIVAGDYPTFFWANNEELAIREHIKLDYYALNISTGEIRDFDNPDCVYCTTAELILGTHPANRVATYYERMLRLEDARVFVELRSIPTIDLWLIESNQQPLWSPDGTQFLFSSDIQGQFDIYLSAAEGGIAERLTYSVLPEQNPSWSSDGTWISYVSYQDGNAEVYVLEVATGQSYNISREARRDYDPVWQPIRQ